MFRHSLLIGLLGLVPALPLVAATESVATPEVTGPSLEDVRRFTEVFRAIKSAYVEPVDDRVLLNAAIRGMLQGLDPHSAYLDERDYADLEEDAAGAYGGLGIEVEARDGVLRVVAPIDDTPAQRAGIKAGDVILRIDGEPIQGANVPDAVDRLRGKPGSEIELTLSRESVGTPWDISLKRETIRVSSVRTRLLARQFAYVRISTFQEETGADMLRKLAKLKQQSPEPLRGLVLDLRTNPGGLLNAAVEVSDAFLDKGLIVYTDGRLVEADLRFEAQPGDILDAAPMVVLIDTGSASAAEIVAGALQDHGRAIVMGQRSFGKGSVQSVLPLDDGNAVKLTTARYFTPKGTSIQARGIEPDIVLANAELRPRAELAAPMREADLANHLGGPGDGATEAERVEFERDYALNEALNLLRGLSLIRARR